MFDIARIRQATYVAGRCQTYDL